MRFFSGTKKAPFIALVVFCANSGWVQSGLAAPDEEKNAALRKALEERISSMQQDMASYQKMMREGEERTRLCKTCHGPEGIAIKANTPNLAGQNPVYIVDQFQRFGDGQRKDFFMSSLAKSFSQEDKVKIALYYSSLPMKSSGGGKNELIGHGEAIYNEVCSSCHGTDGKGQEGYARLAGQRPDYVVKMLKEFRDRTGRRNNPWMSGVALKLSDKDMDAVAAYVASIQGS